MRFASQNLTAGQLNAVVKKLGGEQGALRLLAGELKVVETTETKAPAATLSALKPVNSAIQLDPIAAYDPKGLTTRKGLWVSGDFVSRVRSKAKPVENLGLLSLSSHELTKNAYDREITPGLGENYLFDESELCARIDQMISKQPNGEEGDLLNNGYWNLFYVAGCVVSVYWYSDVRRWNVCTWKLDGYWDAGSRAFSRN